MGLSVLADIMEMVPCSSDLVLCLELSRTLRHSIKLRGTASSFTAVTQFSNRMLMLQQHASKLEVQSLQELRCTTCSSLHCKDTQSPQKSPSTALRYDDVRLEDNLSPQTVTPVTLQVQPKSIQKLPQLP